MLCVALIHPVKYLPYSELESVQSQIRVCDFLKTLIIVLELKCTFSKPTIIRLFSFAFVDPLTPSPDTTLQAKR